LGLVTDPQHLDHPIDPEGQVSAPEPYSGLRKVIATIFTPFAKVLDKVGVTPDHVTVAGTLITMTIAFVLLPSGHVFVGALLLGVFTLFDSLDGVLARLQGSTSKFGAFLDSTCDRFADSAVFVGMTLFFARGPHYMLPGGPCSDALSECAPSSPWVYTWAAGAAIACLVIGSVVPYVRAKAESMGAKAHVGVFERWLRLVGSLVPFGFMGLGLPVIVVAACLTVIAAGSFWTVIERIMGVRRQLGAEK
jgi:CDP-diacylglycerol--glycerol-3-phosphate 3-phosphatidyltransferase